MKLLDYDSDDKLVPEKTKNPTMEITRIHTLALEIFKITSIQILYKRFLIFQHTSLTGNVTFWYIFAIP